MSIFSKIKSALYNTSKNIISSFSSNHIDENFLEKLEEALIISDVGTTTSNNLITLLSKEKIDTNDLQYHTQVKQKLSQIIEQKLTPYEADVLAGVTEHNPYIFLMIGVNGSGKTTCAAKIAHLLKLQKLKPLFVAGDTFRAAATEQLCYWAKILSVECIKGDENADAASVVYSAITTAKNNNFDAVIIDTAGRLQNRTDLLDELKKIKNVIKKLDITAPHKTILVIDGLTGQAAHSQVKTFHQEIGVSGIIVSKLDGTAKGGAIISLVDNFQLPIYAISLGENICDLTKFSAKDFATALCDA